MKNKAIGPFFQTYNCAYALLVPLFWSFISIFHHPKLKNTIFFLLVLCTLFLTQSRSMYVCAAIGFALCVWAVTNFRSPKSLVKTSIIIGVFIVSLVSIYFVYEEDIRANLGYAIQGLEAMSEGNSSSMNTRQAQIDWAVENNTFPYIGAGIGKGDVLLESIYALYYYRYGWLGLLLFLSLTLYTGYVSLKVSKYCKDSRKYFYQALFVFFIMNPVALSSSCHMDMPKTSLIFYGMVGLVFNKYSELTRSKILT